jgi:hypothetical protein
MEHEHDAVGDIFKEIESYQIIILLRKIVAPHIKFHF